MILARVVRTALRRAAARSVGPSLDFLREEFARAAELAPRPPPVPEPPLAKVIPLRLPSSLPPPPELEDVPSPWDPEEPGSDIGLVAKELTESGVRLTIPPPPPKPWRDEELLQQEIQGCKQLLIEIIRRAAYDWVLYRGRRRLVQRTLADTAYRWLFTEKEGTADWQERLRDGKYITSFEAICEGLDLDPEKVRRYIRLLTPKNVTSVGRPAEYRRRSAVSKQSDEDVYSLPDGLVSLDDVDSGDDNSGL